LFHVLSALCVTSLNARNIFVENGGTVVVNILTVLTAFLPLGARFSLDALLRSWRALRETSAEQLNDRGHPAPALPRVTSLAVLALLVQWSAIYFFNTVHKNGAGWRDGSAIHWFLQQDRIVTSTAIWVREHFPSELLRGLTWGTLVVEGALSVLILLPFWQTWARRVVLLLVWSLHGTIALFARLGPFSYAMSLFPILLLGERDWALLARWFSSPARAATVVYDGGSPLALAICRLLKRVDPFARLTFVDQTAPGVFVAVATAGGAIARGQRAVRAVVRALPGGLVPAALLGLPGVRALVGAACRRIAAHQQRIAAALGLDAEPAREPPPPPLRRALARLGHGAREVAVGLILLAILSQLALDNAFVNQRLRIRRPEWMALVIDYPRLYQGWTMFAPEPPYEDGHVVIDGRTAGGSKLDPFTGREPDFSPEAPRGLGHDQFWCDYHNRIRFPGHAGNLQHLREYLLRQHEFSGDPRSQLVAFDVWWVQDRSPAPGEHAVTPLEPQRLLSYGAVADSGAAPWRTRTSSR
jgi:hypothetical protein